ncbi:MAG: ABC transporter permease [Chitinophagaceae bacterium]|nr:ABC transporter permease [Chitinophagaceae bacterium]
MIKNYFKTAWRNLWKNKAFSAINIIGLAIGMSACIIIMLFVFYEKSFDSFHSRNIYRLNEVQKYEGMVAPQNVALSMFPMGPTLKNEFPEIKNYTRINDFDDVGLNYLDKKVFLPKMYWTDSSFFEIFDFELLKGDKVAVLEKPGSVVLTEESAAKIFGKEEPLGKTLVYYGNDTISFVITGILKNIPRNSHLQFDGLFSLSTVAGANDMNNWDSNWLVTYLDLSDNANIATLQKKFPAYLKKHMSNEGWKNYELFLQPLLEVHSNSMGITHDYLNFQKFDKNYTRLFSIIAFIVLVIACINFMNLSTAKSAGRAKEVGIRKSIGAERSQLAFQFIGESVLISLLALIMAVIFVKLSLPYVSQLSQRTLNFPLSGDPTLMLIVLIGTIMTGIIAGVYPAIYLSSFQPTKVLKGSPETGNNRGIFRNILVVGQFTSAVFLMIATVFAIRQLHFMQTRDPGFNREQVMTIRLDSKSSRKYDALKEEFLKNVSVTGVTASNQRLGNNLHQSGVKYVGDGPERQLTSSQILVDEDYVNLYNIRLAAGKSFSKDLERTPGGNVIINESLAKELLKDNPGSPLQTLIGKRFGFSWIDTLGTIVGVAKDFNFNSLHHKIETLFMLYTKNARYGEISVKINGAKAQQAIAHIQSSWKTILADQPLEYGFLDEHFNELYKADMQVSEIVGVLAMLAIVISCLGLFGLASYSAERRVKEIGIRKVMGASVQNVVTLLSRDFIKLVLIANIIAWPIAWFALRKWLQDFAYRIEINWWIFFAAGACAVLIALLTISFQAIKAAIANPIKSLRSE